jgi:N6-adenosine-specific RNA methylase IME4
MVWLKDKIGMGYYAREQHEHLLIGKRGKPPVPDPKNRPASVVKAPRGEHSEKPSVVYDLIMAMWPNARRLEMFARGEPRLCWDAWGNEVVGMKVGLSQNGVLSEKSQEESA